MDRFSGQRDPASCEPLFSALSDAGDRSDGGKKSIYTGGNSGEISEICVHGKLLRQLL